jgi:capsid protein
VVVSVLRGNKFYSYGTGAQYDGEKIPGDLSGWREIDSDPNNFLRKTYNQLAQRAMTLYHTCPPVIGAIDKQTEYAIGEGLLFRSQPNYRVLGMTPKSARSWARDFEQAVEFEFSRLNFFQKQGALFRTALAQGDSLLYFIRDGAELDLIEMPGLVIDADVNDDSHTLGIKHDDWFRRTGFVDNKGNNVAFRENGRQNVVQFYIKRAARQVRGWPLSYSIISLAKNDDRHTDATLDTAVMESMVAWVTESNNPAGDRQQFDSLLNNTRVKKGPIAAAMEKIGSLRGALPGSILNFNAGGKMTPLDKKTPGATFGQFKDWMLDYIGMATGTPPEVIKSKYSTSYTAHKGALNDFVKSFMSKREAFVESICYPALREVTIGLLMRGEIDMPGFFESERNQRAWLDGVWLGPGIGAINPAQEINAKKTAVEAGFALRGDEAYAVSGATDYEAFTEKRNAEEELFRGKNKKVPVPPDVKEEAQPESEQGSAEKEEAQS